MAAIPGDPLTAAASSFASSVGAGLTGGSAASDGRFSSPFDASGWNVNFGDGDITSDRKQAGELSAYLPYAVLAAAVLLAWRLTRKK